MNTRSIPTATCQVLHVLSCPGGGGVTLGGFPPGWGAPHPDLAGRYPRWTPWLGYPVLPGQGGTLGRCPWLGTPHPNLAGGYHRWVHPGWGTPHPDLARGVPWAGTTLAGASLWSDLAGVPLLIWTWLGHTPPAQVWTH